MISTRAILLLFLLSSFVLAQTPKKCCQSYDKSGQICLTCPDGSFFYGNNCTPEVQNCLQFADCLLCSKCADGFNLVDSDTNGVRDKKCQQSTAYGTIDLEKKSEQGNFFDAYLIADDYMRSFHKEVKTGKVLVANQKSVGPSIYHIMIDFEAPILDPPQTKYYRTVMQIDLVKFDFKQISYSQIPKSDIGIIKSDPTTPSPSPSTSTSTSNQNKQPIDTTGTLGQTSVNGEYLDKKLDLREAVNLKLVQAADAIVRGTSLIYKKVVSVKVRANAMGKEFVEITYTGNDDENYTFLIDGTTRKVVNINGVALYQAPGSVAPKKEEAKPVVSFPPSPANPPANDAKPQAPTQLPPTPTPSQTAVSTPDTKSIPSASVPPSTPPAPTANSSPAPTTSPSPTSVATLVPSNGAPAGASPQPSQPSTTPSTTVPSNSPPAATASVPTQATTSPQGPPASPVSVTVTPVSVSPTPVPPPPSSSAPAPTTQSPPRSASTEVPSPSVIRAVDPKTGFWPRESTAGYVSQNNIDLLKDLKFLVVKDLLNKKLTGYQDILPTSCFTRSESDTKAYLMSYNKPDGNQTQVLVKIKILSYTTELVYQRRVGAYDPNPAPAPPAARIYVPKDLTEVTKNSFFIPAAVQISRLPNGYTSENLVSVAVNEDEPNTIYFKAVYNVNGRVWEVEAQTKKKLRIGQVLSEKDITPPGTIFATPVKVQPKAEVPSVPDTTTPPSSPVITSSVPQDKPVVEDKKPAPAPVPVSKPVQPYSSGFCQIPKTTPKFDQLLKFQKDIQIPQIILNQVAGFSQLQQSSAKTDASFLKVEYFVQCSNWKILKDAQIMAVFSKIVSFSMQYKIYFENAKKTVFQAYATFDRLRNKIYIINFNPISFGVQ